MDSILAFFNGLSEPDNPYEFEYSLSEYVNSKITYDNIDYVRQILETIDNEDIKYAAFFSLILFYRKEKDVDSKKDLFGNETYISLFENRPTFKNLVLVWRLTFQEFENPLKMLEEAEVLINKSVNAADDHLYADIFITMLEKEIINNANIDVEKGLDKALAAVTTAIRLNDKYAKYYSTKARILSCQKEYYEALASINKAIELETPKSSNYAQKMIDYTHYKSMILMRMEVQNQLEIVAKLSESSSKINEKLDSSIIRNLEILGLFTAIISFTLGSIGIAQQETTINAAKLIIILFMSILFVFSSFDLLLKSSLSKARQTRRDFVYYRGTNIFLCIFSFITIVVLLIWMK